MKSGFLRRLLTFVLLTLLVSAVLTAALFTYTSRNLFANMKARDMAPAAQYISEIVSQYQRGDIGPNTFERLLNSDPTLWGATVLIFNKDGTLLAHTPNDTFERIQQAIASDFLPDMLAGKTGRLVTSSDKLGLVVGAPVYGVDASVSGAVFLTKPLNEVNAALSGLNTALVMSILIVSLAVILPAYFVSRSMSRPILHMAEAARAMARGDYAVKADDRRRDEIGALGRSLNELSGALATTIGDLVLERNRLRSVLDGLREGVVAVDGAGRVTHCNPSALRLLDGDAMDWSSVVQNLAALWPGYPQALDSEPASFTVQKGGTTLKITVTRLTGQDERRAGAVTMVRDVTEEARLEQTRRDYVANVSHELRTPIASIRGIADALNDGMVKTDEDRARYYGYILRESMRLSRLINDLLELSRLQSGAVALEKRPFALNDLLMELSERFEAAAGDSGLKFQLDLPDHNAKAFSNEDRVEQVLVALLDNAIKYAADEGAVTLRAEPTETGYLVSVCNTGHIREEHLPHLFERFYKADQAHAEQGTGLGLAIAKEVMTLLGERIWAENAGDEACFRFTLTKA